MSGLVTIDDKTYIEMDEYALLTTYKAINYLTHNNHPRAALEHMTELGVVSRRGLYSSASYVSDRVLAQQIRRMCTAAFSTDVKVRVGEVAYDGNVYGSEKLPLWYPWHGDGGPALEHPNMYADLGGLSKGSLIGLVFLELARRLEEEAKADDIAREAVPWEPPEEAPDDPPPADG